MMETKTIQKRQVAWKVLIKDLLEGEYVKGEGEWQPNYILHNEKKVARANILGVVIGKEDSQFGSLRIDDGSGQIVVRSFEQNPGLMSSQPGSLVLIIGRPREYMQERYVVAEIVREITDKTWFEIRKKETNGFASPIPPLESTLPKLPKEPTPAKTLPPKKETNEVDPEVVCALIKEKDDGAGADMQEIIDHLQRDDGEEIVKRMLAQGELFEVQPGKIKVLE
ncbi:MAG: hypothetical protein O3C23_02545 [bacterium]|nr:hypothetical protein [bacterium]